MIFEPDKTVWDTIPKLYITTDEFYAVHWSPYFVPRRSYGHADIGPKEVGFFDVVPTAERHPKEVGPGVYAVKVRPAIRFFLRT